MQYAICDVRVSELHTKQLTCPPWEVPVLQAIHGENVQVIGQQEVDRDPPDPDDEYKRLCNRYSSNKEESNSIVAQVYGTYDSGIKALAKAIGEADKGHSKVSSGEAITKDLERRQKAEVDALKDKQAREREQFERDAKARVRAQELRNEAAELAEQQNPQQQQHPITASTGAAVDPRAPVRSPAQGAKK
jgi:hypothetical protein